MSNQRTQQKQQTRHRTQMRRRTLARFISITTATGVLVLLMVAIWGLTAGQRPQSLSAYGGEMSDTTPNPTGQTTAIFSDEGYRATAMAIMTTLPMPTLDPHWPADKAHDVAVRALSDEAYATAHALYPAPPDYDPRSYITRTPEPVIPTEVSHNTPTTNGMIHNGGNPGPPCTGYLYQTNSWEGQLNGQTGDQFTGVCSGEDRIERSHGAVVVEVGSHNSDQHSEESYYRTATETGPLRIVDEMNGQIILRTANGSLLDFDLATRQWVSPTPGPSPSASISPMPSVSPLSTAQP